MKANLNNELVIIDTEKGDYELDPINADAWYFQNLDEEAFSYQAFVVWGIYDNPNPTDVIRGNAIKQHEIFFEICIPDDGGPLEENVFYRMLRYTRALESVVNKNFDKIRSGLNVTVSSLTPTSFDLSGKTFRTAGVLIKAAMSAN
jgi:hypothetical protein